MPIEARKNLLPIGGAGLVFGLAGWALYAELFSFAPAQDFMVFYTAARACIEGNLPLIFDGDAFTAQINQQFGAWLASPLNLHPSGLPAFVPADGAAVRTVPVRRRLRTLDGWYLSCRSTPRCAATCRPAIGAWSARRGFCCRPRPRSLPGWDRTPS